MISGNSNVVAATAMVLAMASSGHGLVTRSHGSFVAGRRRNPSPAMSMYLDDVMPIASIVTSAAASISVAPPNPFAATSRLIASDPELEAELLDVGNAALDVSTLLGPNTVWLRLGNVFGRALVLFADCLRSVHIPLDEWAFHAVMLAISLHLFERSARPLLVAVCSVSSLSVRDRRAYSLLFEAVGLTVLQFKALLSSRYVRPFLMSPKVVRVQLLGCDIHLTICVKYSTVH